MTSPFKLELSEEAQKIRRKYMREYMRKWRKENPEKYRKGLKSQQERYWTKKAQEQQ